MAYTYDRNGNRTGYIDDRAIATITAETTRGVLTAPAAILTTAVVIVPDGMIAVLDIRTITAVIALGGTIEILDTPTTTRATIVEGDRSIKDWHHHEPIL